jgi:hypothetical protein
MAIGVGLKVGEDPRFCTVIGSKRLRRHRRTTPLSVGPSWKVGLGDFIAGVPAPRSAVVDGFPRRRFRTAIAEVCGRRRGALRLARSACFLGDEGWGGAMTETQAIQPLAVAASSAFLARF